MTCQCCVRVYTREQVANVGKCGAKNEQEGSKKIWGEKSTSSASCVKKGEGMQITAGRQHIFVPD